MDIWTCGHVDIFGHMEIIDTWGYWDIRTTVVVLFGEFFSHMFCLFYTFCRYTLSLNMFCRYTLCHFIPFVVICFVSLYFLSIYVLSFYAFCRYMFSPFIPFVVIRSVIIRFVFIEPVQVIDRVIFIFLHGDEYGQINRLGYGH
jgi:hypothetical protein